MKVDEYGTVGYLQSEIVEYLRINPSFNIANISILDGTQYLESKKKTYIDVPDIKVFDDLKYNITSGEYHKQLQEIWLMPEEYQNLNIEEWLQLQCKTQEELDRVNIELVLYKQFNLIKLLKYLKYLRDVATKNQIVWGVGRGSACASYCLFLLKIHRVDSIYYGLDITDFLR